MKKIIQKTKEKITGKKKRTQEDIEKEREAFFNSEEYIIMATVFHYKNPDNMYRVNLDDAKEIRRSS